MISHRSLSKVPLDLRPVVLRRAQWLLNEAQQRDARFDDAVKHLMRVLSSYVTLGSSYNSPAIKKKNPRVSSAAKKMVSDKTSFLEWHRCTVNEHQKPISEMWNDLVRLGKSWTVADVL